MQKKGRGGGGGGLGAYFRAYRVYPRDIVIIAYIPILVIDITADFAGSLVDCMQDKSCSWLGGHSSETNQSAGPHLKTYMGQNPRCSSL